MVLAAYQECEAIKDIQQQGGKNCKYYLNADCTSDF